MKWKWNYCNAAQKKNNFLIHTYCNFPAMPFFCIDYCTTEDAIYFVLTSFIVCVHKNCFPFSRVRLKGDFDSRSSVYTAEKDFFLCAICKVIWPLNWRINKARELQWKLYGMDGKSLAEQTSGFVVWSFLTSLF